MEQFANDAPELRDEAFQETAAQLGMSKAIIEKDFWVCWSLKQLFALPAFGEQMIFKGGTSLSKAYDVIHRFSEDVDLSLDRERLGFVGDRDPDGPGPVTLSCRPRCSFKPPFVRRRQGFSSPELSGGVADCRSR